MKKDIHPKYEDDASVKCLCGNKILAGSTTKDMHVEICSACHPFFTGKEKIIDTAGRVEKFKAKANTAKEKQDKLKTSKTKTEKKQARANKSDSKILNKK